MPFVDLNGGRIHYRLDVSSQVSRETPCVVLSNSLGTNLSMWDPQVPPLLPHFRVLRYDTRGHGLSSVTPGPYSNEQLARDVVSLLGGMAGMRLAIAAPERMDKLVLSSTGAKIGSAESWKVRIDTVVEKGMAAVTEAIMGRWFTSGFVERNPSVIQPIREMLLECSTEGYVACSAAVRDTDERDAISHIRARALVISGRYDPATPPSDGRFLAERIPGAQYVEIEGSHLSNVECAGEFNDALLKFLRG